jgi:anti-anti-sigma regulatory factor
MATPATGASQGNIRPQSARTPGRIGSEDFHSAPLPVTHEAAVLYSGNHTPAATQLLKAEIKDVAGRNNKQAWLMLFDLYQAAQDRAEFDSLSMLFTVKFEQSPPAWAESESGGDPRRAQGRERKDYFALKPSATGELVSEIDKFVAFAEAQASVRLDVGKLTSIGSEEAALLAAALAKLRRQQVAMWFNHLDALEAVLRAAFNEKPLEEQRSYWSLLFELLILQGKMQEFEDLGLEFAVAFEMSPPSWEAYVNPVSVAAKGPAPEKAANEPSAADAPSGFALKGVISASSANQLAELNGYAASRSEVPIDMSKVMRIDFAFTGAFYDAVKAMQLAGKRVVMTELNELNASLLEAIGVNRYAILVRRKST